MPAGALAETVDRVARAASRDEVRPILTGIMVSVEEIDADDGRHRLLPAQRQADRARGRRSRGRSRRTCRPGRMRELARLVARRRSRRSQIALPGNQIIFRAGTVTLSSRLIDGQFPNYRQLLPDAFDHDVRLPRAELLDVTRRIRYLAQRNAPLQARLRGGRADGRRGDARDRRRARVDAVRVQGEAMEIAFNPQFFIEGIESVETEELVLRLTSPLRPGLLQPAGSEDFSYLVMPIRLTV